MKKFFRNKILALAIALGAIGSVAGVALAGICPQTLIIIGPGTVEVCTLEMEFSYEGFEEVDCFYSCDLYYN